VYSLKLNAWPSVDRGLSFYTADNMLQGAYYSDGTGVEYQYDAFRRKVARTQTYYDMDKIGKGLSVGQGKGRGQGQGRGQSDKGIQNALNRGNGEKKGLIDQLLSAETTVPIRRHERLQGIRGKRTTLSSILLCGWSSTGEENVWAPRS
jgi:hypothetical protein